MAWSSAFSSGWGCCGCEAGETGWQPSESSQNSPAPAEGSSAIQSLGSRSSDGRNGERFLGVGVCGSVSQEGDVGGVRKAPGESLERNKI